MRTLYTNGTVITMDPGCPQTEALVTEGDRIIGLGDAESMKHLAGPSCRMVDMEGGALYPGFNETHNHLSLYAILRQYAYLGNAVCIDDLIDTLTTHGENRPSGSGEPMIIGYAYDDTGLEDTRQINRHDLDRVSDRFPVVVLHISMHLGFLNTRAMEYFGITADSKAEPGGVIHKDASGVPTGRLDEMSWFSVMAQIESPDENRYRILLQEAAAEFNRQGFTGVHDAGIGLEGMPATVFNSYRYLARNKKLTLRVFASATHDVFDAMAVVPGENLAEDYFAFGGVKMFLDGSIQAGTAALQEPYCHDSSLRGELIMEEETFTGLVKKYHALGRHISVHGNGDVAIETIISAFEAAQKECPKPGSRHIRHMLIHAQMSHPDHISRMKAAHIIPSFFGMHVHHWGDRHRDVFLGEKRARRINPAGEAQHIGLPFTLHVDTPVLPPQAILSIHTAVNRTTRNGNTLGKEFRITPYSALGAYTSMAALCSSSEDIRGTIAAGKLADLTLLSKDILTCPGEDILDADVLCTVVGGKVVYRASPVR